MCNSVSPVNVMMILQQHHVEESDYLAKCLLIYVSDLICVFIMYINSFFYLKSIICIFLW